MICFVLSKINKINKNGFSFFVEKKLNNTSIVVKLKQYISGKTIYRVVMVVMVVLLNVFAIISSFFLN